ncbi:MAG TPA: hypothetical protein VMH92_02585 [Acidocella sp.]|nr:hypothetical protein [Acidocella sp.]
MATQPDHTAQETGFEVDFDSPSKRGWAFFTKFLFWNVVAAAAILILIAALTVWR